MGNNGMNPKAPGQTNPGGECMNYQEITIGQVTYEISRVYTGERSAAELVSERLAKQLSESPSFDEQHTRGV